MEKELVTMFSDRLKNQITQSEPEEKNIEYLNEFGKKLVETAYNVPFAKYCDLNDIDHEFEHAKQLEEVVRKLSNSEKEEIAKYIDEIFVAEMHDVMFYFEMHSGKLILACEADEKQIDLSDVSHNEGRGAALHCEIFDWIEMYCDNGKIF